MSQCLGDLTLCTKTDREMLEFIDAEAERLGVTRAELVRRLYEFYRESRRESLDCAECGETIIIDLSHP